MAYKPLIQFAILAQFWLQPTLTINGEVITRVDVGTLAVFMDYYNQPGWFCFYEVVQCDVANKTEGLVIHAPFEQKAIYWDIEWEGRYIAVPIGYDWSEL
ncbi:MAG: hypothetical protein GY869_14710 [Planctomycetes bacterium]|nr:hypothetical protein [Planctomycetota bacterium]